MSVQAITWVLECSEAKLGARLVLLSIANHADRKGANAWPSVATIAFEARMSERQVQYALRELVKIGELQVERGKGPKGTNRYRLPGLTEPVLPLREPQDAGAGGANIAPPQNPDSDGEGGAESGREGCRIAPKGVRDSAPEPSRTVKEPRARERDDLTVALAGRVLALLGDDQLPADSRRTIVPMQDWLAGGADADADVLPTIEAIVAARRREDPAWRPHSWHEFTEPIAAAAAARAAGTPQPSEGIHASGA